ncbi:MAG: ABC transporter ATP-binding protein [Chloroflexi bacterium]|nr:ABC transporter ATP-binding protein [Chloroflexota bacterium]
MLEISIRKKLDGFKLNIDLSAQENETIVLFGPSGAGKSMTLAVVGGFLTPDAGRIAVGERVLFDSQRRIDLPPQQRRIGLVKQDLALFPHLTVEQNVAYGLFREAANAQHERVRNLLRLMNLDGFANRFPFELSGGQQQRIALARALAPSPSLLLLDEPFSALDAPTRMQLRDELLTLHREVKIPVVFVTHDLGEAYFLADKLAVVSQGEIIQIDKPGEVLSHPCSLNAARAIGVKNILAGEIVARSKTGSQVRVGEMLIDTLPSSFEVGTRVNVCMRPERIMLLRPERAAQSSDENALHGEIVREMNDGMTTTLFFRGIDQRLGTLSTQNYDIQIELPVYIYERLNLARQRTWTVSLRKNAIHLMK